MAGFSLIADPDTTEYRTVRTSGSQAYTIGDLVVQDFTADALDVVPATSAIGTEPSTVYGVAMQTIAAAGTTLLVALVSSRQRWAADTTNNTVVNDQMERMIMGASASVVNNTHTDDTSDEAVFQQLGVIGALTAKRIVGRFLVATGVTA